jgi:hypothetical protein
VTAADPYSFCSGYKIHITRDATAKPACFQGYGGSYMSGVLSLAPGDRIPSGSCSTIGTTHRETSATR